MDIERLERIEKKCDEILELLSEKHPKRPQRNELLYDGCSKCGARRRCEDAFQPHSHLCNSYGKETPSSDCDWL